MKSEHKLIDLQLPSHAYMYGFMQADGHLREGTRNRGNMSIELSKRDSSILDEFAKLLPTYSSISDRTRDTNFKDDYESSTLRVYDWDFRKELIRLGMTVGRKDTTMAPPRPPFSEIDYVRGLIDANGSVGTAEGGFPFISLFTASESIKVFVCAFIENVTGKRMSLNRNTRDDAYNICLFREDAQSLIRLLYYSGALALPRKLAEAQAALRWERPSWIRRAPPRKRWLPSEDAVVLTQSPQDAAKLLDRTLKSVAIRKWRLLSAS